MFNLRNLSLFKLIRFINTYFSQYKLTIVLLSVLNFLSSFLEGLGINAIIPLFSFISIGSGEPTDVISQAIKKFFSYFNVAYTLKHLLIFIALLFVIKTALYFFSQYINLMVRSKYERDSRNELLALTVGGDWLYLSKQKIGHLEQAITMNIEMGSKFLLSISSLLLILANLFVYSLLAVNISPTITALTLFFGLALFYGYKPLFKKIREASNLTVKEYKNIAHYVNEIILGIKIIKAGFVERQAARKASNFFETLRELRIKSGLYGIMAAVTLQLAPIFFILGIFAIFYKTSIFNFSSFAVIVYAINRVFINFQSIQAETNSLISLAPFLTTVQNYRNEALSAKEEDKGVKNFNFNDRLEFANVSFTYGAKHRTVSNINFVVKKGEILGLVGPSGAGKTTIVDLFLRLLKPQKGLILLDGVDISEISLKEWRTNVGYVSQDVFLFNDTIASNIRFYDDSLREEDIVKAAKMADIYDFIMKQPEKFKTVIGERGTKLSGGQRQRLALARVLARQPKLLILDEATSALDNESEIAVQKTIESLRGKITVVTIAHRLTTVINFDRLIVLKNGRIVEEGKPQDLLQDKNSYFFKVYNLKK